jgi:hypothetical protein
MSSSFLFLFSCFRDDFIEKDSSQINDFDGVDLLPPDYVTDTELKRVNQDFIINSHGKNLLDLCLSSRLLYFSSFSSKLVFVLSLIEHFKYNST